MSLDYNKVWETMNDLEMVTSKICSAREIIDTAVEAIQKNDYDKAETLATAAYEFLEYYLEEFDAKFKLAWQETVTKVKNNDSETYFSFCDSKDNSEYCNNSWNDFWDNYEDSTISSTQYTEEELNAMCDKAASDQEKDKCREYNLREAEYYDKRAKLDLDYSKVNKQMSYDEAVAAGWEMTADGFWFREPKEDKVKKWVLPVQVDGLTGDCYINLPDDLLEKADLKEGDQVQWIDRNDGSFEIRKVTELPEEDGN